MGAVGAVGARVDIVVGLVEGVGHFPHYEAPDRANAEIIKFFKGLSV